jgi:[acyl-carrier-protein] S-malonyltransferase
MSGSAIVFPGMGPSGSAELAKFMVVNPYSRKLVAAADDLLGYCLLDRYRAADGDYTEYAQVAFMVNCLAIAEWAGDSLGLRPDLVAGPSFGGRAAAVYSGSVTFAEGVWLTARLAQVMDEYFACEHTDVVTHSFVRVPEQDLAAIMAELEWCEVSCRIDEDFAMLSLKSDRVDWLRGRLSAVGGLSLYTMRPPMHASILGTLRDRVDEEVFSQVDWRDPRIPVVADQNGAIRNTGEDIRNMMLDGFVRTVCWPSVVDTFKRNRIAKLYVSGPDSMFGRVACTTRNFEVVALNPRTVLRRP